MKRAIVAAVVVVVGLNALFFASGAVLDGPSGNASSSVATTRSGFAAWATLARRDGARVVAERTPLADARLPADAAVVALDVPDLSRPAARRLRRFATGGGTVVAGGRDPGRWIGVLAPGLRWRDGGDADVRPARPERETTGLRSVRAPGGGRWTAGASDPALGAAGAALLVIRPLGAGRLVLLADSSPLTNGGLGSADNAALALGLRGDAPTLVFAEAEHGYGATGIAAIPDGAKWALGLVLAAALALIASRLRRFGPAELPARPLPPPRAAYVDALAATLARTGDPAGAAQPLRAASLRALRLGPDADAPDVERAAAAAGLDAVAVDALVTPVRDDDQVLALAAAHATLTRPPGGHEPHDQGRTP